MKEAEGKASLKEYERQVAFWTGHFKGQPLDAITRNGVADLLEKHKPNGSAATKNRYIACLRAILIKSAGVWEWLDCVRQTCTAWSGRRSIYSAA